jgi:competence protein ComGC
MMTFKKSLRTKNNTKAQATLEYFIIFALIALLTILSLTNFHKDVRSALQGKGGFFQVAVGVDGLNVLNEKK